MTETNTVAKINFRTLTLADKELYESLLDDGHDRGCEFSFSNLYLWGKQHCAVINGFFVLLSKYSEYYVYPYPIGRGDVKPAIDAIIADSRARGIPCRISGIDRTAKNTLELLYPGMFSYQYNEGSFDYIYNIDDLAELAGKKYHGKRNHLYRFRDAHPDYTVEPICEENLGRVKDMTDSWYKAKLEEAPDSDFELEYAALTKAYSSLEGLGMEGLVISYAGEVLAIRSEAGLKTIPLMFSLRRHALIFRGRTQP